MKRIICLFFICLCLCGCVDKPIWFDLVPTKWTITDGALLKSNYGVDICKSVTWDGCADFVVDNSRYQYNVLCKQNENVVYWQFAELGGNTTEFYYFVDKDVMYKQLENGSFEEVSSKGVFVPCSFEALDWVYSEKLIYGDAWAGNNYVVVGTSPTEMYVDFADIIGFDLIDIEADITLSYDNQLFYLRNINCNFKRDVSLAGYNFDIYDLNNTLIEIPEELQAVIG